MRQQVDKGYRFQWKVRWYKDRARAGKLLGNVRGPSILRSSVASDLANFADIVDAIRVHVRLF